MLEQPCAKLHVDPIGGVRKKIGPQDAENGFKQCYPEQSDYQHIECADAAMDKDLVDDHLEEQRRGERKQLKKEGCEEHFSQLSTILVNRAQEPCDVEAARQ